MPDEPIEPTETTDPNLRGVDPLEQEPSTASIASSTPEQTNPSFSQPATGPLNVGDSVPVLTPTQPTFEPAQPQSPLVVKPKGKKRLLIGIIIAVIVVLLGTGTALAYKFWYQNPEKVVTDALIHAVTARSVVYTGTVNVDSDSSQVKFEVTGKQSDVAGSLDAKVTVSVDGKNYAVNGSALIDKSGDLYFKVEHLDDIATEYKKQLSDGNSTDTTVSSLIDKLKAKIDGTWIKVSSDDLKDFSDSYATTKTCFSDALKTFQDDKSVSNEVANLYKKHQFIAIDKALGAKNGSLGYEVSGNKDESKAFFLGLKDTKIYKQLHDCDSSFTIDADDVTPASSGADTASTITVWVSRWTHELSKITISGKDDDATIDMSAEPTFNQKVNVVAPARSTTLSQLESDITELFQSVYTASSSFDDTSVAL